MIDIYSISVTAVACFIAVCMFTTLYGKSNPLYALAEESYIGFGTGLTIVVNLLFIYNTGIQGIQAGDWLLAIGIILGFVVLLRMNPKYSYIARLPIAITIGAQLGLALRTTIFTGFLDQIRATILPLLSNSAQSLIYNWTIALATILMLTFFFYSTEMKGVLGTSSKIGEYVMYAAFGGIFAQTFMGRLSLFVGFMQNYMTPSWQVPYLLGSLIIVFGAVMILDRLKLIEKLTPEE